jgi:predicted ATP-grasp superfamily ATP-dependent carboligase
VRVKRGVYRGYEIEIDEHLETTMTPMAEGGQQVSIPLVGGKYIAPLSMVRQAIDAHIDGTAEKGLQITYSVTEVDTEELLRIYDQLEGDEEQ